jgi:PadR family transcriptional regulator PadR
MLEPKKEPVTLSSDVLRGYNDSIILIILSKGDSYGYQISKMIREISKEHYVMKETTLYSAMNRLEKNGLVESYAGEETQGKARTYYRLTQHGRTALTRRADEWKLTKDVLNVFFKEVTNGSH